MPALDETSTGNSGAVHIADHDALHAWYNAATSNGDDLDGWGAWTAVSGGIGFANSWVNYAGGFQDAEYRKHSDGTVQVRGLIKSGTITSAAFTLPTGYRPVATTIFATDSNNLYGRVSVDSSGNVTPDVGSNAWVSLDVIYFDSTGGS